MEEFRQLSTKLGELLLKHGKMLACAESCTGGLLSGAITSVPGSSGWFDSGLVTYSNNSKLTMLGVNPETLAHFGAVSEETAMEMASGVLANTTSADMSVSVTGIAGPGGAAPGKPVGMVCFGFAKRINNSVVSRSCTKVFQGNRDEVRNQSVIYALEFILQSFKV